MNGKINNIMNKYNLSQRNKIKGFLISEIDDENSNEIIDFVNSFFMRGINILEFFLKEINI